MRTIFRKYSHLSFRFGTKYGTGYRYPVTIRVYKVQYRYRNNKSSKRQNGPIRGVTIKSFHVLFKQNLDHLSSWSSNRQLLSAKIPYTGTIASIRYRYMALQIMFKSGWIKIKSIITDPDVYSILATNQAKVLVLVPVPLLLDLCHSLF